MNFTIMQSIVYPLKKYLGMYLQKQKKKDTRKCVFYYRLLE